MTPKIKEPQPDPALIAQQKAAERDQIAAIRDRMASTTDRLVRTFGARLALAGGSGRPPITGL